MCVCVCVNGVGKTTLSEGGLASLAAVLERFRTFHENLESISSESHASLSRIIRWLKGS